MRKTQVAAEKLMILMGPIMMICMYGCMLAVYWFGAKFTIGGEMTIGKITSFLTYIMQVLMSLMMIAFSGIQLVISRASISRIVEVSTRRSISTIRTQIPILNPPTDRFRSKT